MTKVFCVACFVALLAGIMGALWTAETWALWAFGVGALGVSMTAPLVIFEWMGE